MRKTTVMATAIAAWALIALAPGARAQDADAIVKKARNLTAAAKTVMTHSRMVITAKDGKTTEREIVQYAKDDANGLARTVIEFRSPKSVKGTRFLTMDNDKGKSDQWIFLPGLGKVRRIAASEGSGNFMGTDFSYDDMSMMDRDTSLDDHAILGGETLNGADCWKIQSTPKTADYQYAKTVLWIDKANSRIYKAELYDKRGAVVKILEISGYKDVQGYDTATQTKVSTVAAGTSTTIYILEVKYDETIPEAVFTTTYLETGRAR